MKIRIIIWFFIVGIILACAVFFVRAGLQQYQRVFNQYESEINMLDKEIQKFLEGKLNAEGLSFPEFGEMTLEVITASIKEGSGHKEASRLLRQKHPELGRKVLAKLDSVIMTSYVQMILFSRRRTEVVDEYKKCVSAWPGKWAAKLLGYPKKTLE